jgi:endonuclease/exonuclease/phosphatase family metal-dependent hydrolase
MRERRIQTLWRILLAGLIAVLFTTATQAQLPSKIRVLSYNIHHGEGTDGRFDLPRIAKVIKSASPDIVALQEVDQGTARARGVDQPAELARLTGMAVVFGRNIDYQGGGYGTAVLTKLPVKASASEKFPSFYEGTAENAEQRVVQVVELGPAGAPGLVFLCTHLDYRPDDRERMASVELINGLASKYGDRLMVLAGDLNATPDSAVIRALEQRWKIAGGDARQLLDEVGTELHALNSDGGNHLLTYPAKRPTKHIDYVLYRPANRWQVVEARVLDERVASDHRPLLAVLLRVP